MSSESRQEDDPNSLESAFFESFVRLSTRKTAPVRFKECRDAIVILTDAGVTTDEIWSWCEEDSTVDVSFVVDGIHDPKMDRNYARWVEFNKKGAVISHDIRARLAAVREDETIDSDRHINMVFLSFFLAHRPFDWKNVETVISGMTGRDASQLLMRKWSLERLSDAIRTGMDTELIFSITPKRELFPMFERIRV